MRVRPDGAPDFSLICERMLMRQPGVAVTYVIFDLLSLEGRGLMGAPYSERRAQLGALHLNGCAGRHPKRSTTDPRSSRRCARTSSRASSRNDAAAVTSQRTVVGSRSKTARTRAMRWS
jgi:ATP-dependent DNA ligase